MNNRLKVFIDTDGCDGKIHLVCEGQIFSKSDDDAGLIQQSLKKLLIEGI